MFSVTLLTSFILSLSFSSSVLAAQEVFSHFIVGNSASYTVAQWTSDINTAIDAGIDGFALNIGGDSYTSTQLSNAFTAAQNVGNFFLFISFDYGANPDFTTAQVQSYVNQYSSSPAYFQYLGKPLVSTFEGPNAGDTDWTIIGSQYSLIPDWSSLGPSDFASRLSEVVGALAWTPWPDFPSAINTTTDEAWISTLNGKAYMMAISPWFYANVDGKNWLWSGNGLWHTRWQEAIQLQPDFVEVLTWNDFGESHYIGPIVSSGIPSGSTSYVDNTPHDAWRTFLPYYIQAYKANNANLVYNGDGLVYYHRLNPYASGSADGTVTNTAAYQTTYLPQDGSPDEVNIDVQVTSAATLSVRIGTNTALTFSLSTGYNGITVPFNGQTGTVQYVLTRSGSTVLNITGATITENCVDGNVNWNAIVGGATTSA
ncbi:MAG: hypothetical protein MMC33_009083 [Icmadophila ericetorum]|nr:hypothetical protein [Icmadophila ericetorum]